jgi:crossover junction endodeoxyribonuclease RuvC
MELIKLGFKLDDLPFKDYKDVGVVVGVDPGKSGAIFAQGLDGTRAWFAPMPIIADQISGVNIASILRLFENLRHVFVEKAQAMPGQGVSSMFNYGLGAGIVQGVIESLGVPYTLVGPKKWQKEMFAGTPSSLESKEKSALAASRLWPSLDFRSSPRCKKVNSGFTDAALICEWGRRLLLGAKYK